MRKLLLRALVVLLAAGAAWWLFWLTPTRGGQRPDTIRFGFWGDYQEYQMWQRVVAEFGRRHPEIHVDLEHIPGAGEYARKMAAWLAADSLPDVVLLLDQPFPRYIDKRDGRTPVLADLTRLVDESALDPNEFWPTAWASFGAREGDGYHQYALPVFGGNNLIFYNRQCFRRAGLPLPQESHIDQDWTLEQFEDLCRKLTIRQGEGKTARTVQWGFDMPAGWLYWLPFIYACDADILSPDRTEFIFTGPGALCSLRLWRRLIDDHLVPRGGELGQMRQNVAFLTGRVAMVCDGPWQMAFLNEAKLDYGVMFPPRSAAGVRGTRITWNGVGLAARLSKDPGRLRQAWLFAAFAASPEAGRIVAQVQRSIPACRAAGQAFAAGSEPARAGKFIAAMEFSRLQPITLKWNDMDNALYNALGKLTIARRGDDGQCDVTPESTLDTMADAMVKRRLFPVRRPDGTLRPMEERP